MLTWDITYSLVSLFFYSGRTVPFNLTYSDFLSIIGETIGGEAAIILFGIGGRMNSNFGAKGI